MNPPPIPDAALADIRAALTDAQLLNETIHNTAERISQYLISTGWRITPDIDDRAA